MSSIKTITVKHILRAVKRAPGQHAGSYRTLVGAKTKQVGRTLRAAEKRGEVASARVDNHVLWFPIKKVAK
jgi:hypothetical protein